jgi:large subunit ribosomal protein L15
MASKSPAQLLQTLTRWVQQRYAYAGSATVQSSGRTVRKFSYTSVKADKQEWGVRPPLNADRQEQSGRPPLDTDGQEQRELPHWLRTPPRMRAPVTLNSGNRPYTCNNDPAKLDAMYTRLFGSGRGNIISEDVKWLAVTHKSFDQGRRGFNDRLAYLGVSPSYTNV